MNFNVNDYVWIRLTDHGRKIHRDHHSSVFERVIDRYPYEPPKEDYQGWSRWQMWHVFELFGSACGMCKPLPFETYIRFEAPDTVKPSGAHMESVRALCR